MKNILLAVIVVLMSSCQSEMYQYNLTIYWEVEETDNGTTQYVTTSYDTCVEDGFFQNDSTHGREFAEMMGLTVLGIDSSVVDVIRL